MQSNLTEAKIDLSCTFDDAERNHLLDGLRMSVEQRVAWFEEATALVYLIEKRVTECGPPGDQRPGNLNKAFELLATMSPDCFPEERNDPPPEEREAFD
jgi:hypothetical protein